MFTLDILFASNLKEIVNLNKVDFGSYFCILVKELIEKINRSS